jgi:hypothetical protein
MSISVEQGGVSFSLQPELQPGYAHPLLPNPDRQGGDIPTTITAPAERFVKSALHREHSTTTP